MTRNEQGAEDAARATLLTLLGPVAVWIAGMALAASVVPDVVPEGACEGIGFGCQLTPRDGVGLAGVLAGVVAVPVATVLAAIAGMVGRGPHGRRVARVRTVLVVFALITLGFVLLATASSPST